MNTRIFTVVMTAALVTTTTGCGPFRNFFLGRGAQCGMCNRAAPQSPSQQPCGQQAPPKSKCGLFSRFQKRHAPTPAAAPSGCGCNTGPCHTDPCASSGGYGPVSDGSSVISGYAPDPYSSSGPYVSSDPYSSTVIGNGVVPGTVIDGQPVYGDDFGPAPLNNQGVRAYYPNYSGQGFKTDSDGYRIIREDPLPPGAMSVN